MARNQDFLIPFLDDIYLGMDIQTLKERVFGRKKGKPIRAFQQSLLDTLLPQLSVPHEKLLKEKALLPAALFDKPYEKYFMEIGYGAGEHLAYRTEEHPTFGYIGAEIFLNGTAALLKHIKDRTTYNLRLHNGDALSVLKALQDNSLDGIYILNPDPWPKRRHFDRRMVNKNNMEIFVRVLKPDGFLMMTTDVADLADWMGKHAEAHPQLVEATNPKNRAQMPENWRETRYEAWGKSEGRTQVYMVFTKKT
ncbi:MAG: tRNA (guanosine(46)-N7)-methyltransferase TrmB [Alphaproteobacteria bacterium]|nr:tRNA (guanosine(46)-N7)-methyltransferase TrmB [Alphaproteobacteria bacterium]